jgi:uncharacterized protein
MLIEFRLENHRSIRDEQVLTMEAGRSGIAGDPRPRLVAGHIDAVLPVAVIYGANASGKSNVLSGMSFMRDAVLESHRFWSPDEGVPRNPFAWGKKRSKSSFFEVTLLLDGIRYVYGFDATDDAFDEEWLYAWPNGKKQTWFERERNTFKFGEHFKGENKLIEEVTRPNALFLSAAVQLKHAQLAPIYAWFRRLEVFNISSPRRGFMRPSTEFLLSRVLEDDDSRQPLLFDDIEPAESLADRFRSLLKSADIGIVDVRIAKSVDDEEHPRLRRSRVQLKHQSDATDAWLPLNEESQGTRTLFRLAMPILQSIRRGGTIIVDELESSLHPSLAQQIVRQFNLPESNPNNAQLIFTTHDTNLLGSTLGEPVVRRDEVWLTEKDSDGASVLYPLTDFKPRKSENLERGYLQGRYGAIPFLGNFSLGG